MWWRTSVCVVHALHSLPSLEWVAALCWWGAPVAQLTGADVFTVPMTTGQWTPHEVHWHHKIPTREGHVSVLVPPQLQLPLPQPRPPPTTTTTTMTSPPRNDSTTTPLFHFRHPPRNDETTTATATTTTTTNLTTITTTRPPLRRRPPRDHNTTTTVTSHHHTCFSNPTARCAHARCGVAVSKLFWLCQCWTVVLCFSVLVLAGGSCIMAALPYYLQPSDIDLEPVVPSLGGNLPWAVGRWPQDVEIEFCTRASFHTKHKPEKYLKYFNDVKFAFQQRYPHVIVKGNPEVCEGQGRPWKFVHHLGPAGDVFRPRFGAFEVTMRSEWHGVQRVFSKLESRCWPKAESLVRRAELLLDGGTVLLKPLPPVAKRPERLPGVDALKVRRNLIKDETRCERTWIVPVVQNNCTRRDLANHF